jgi:hypothetical protein
MSRYNQSELVDVGHNYGARPTTGLDYEVLTFISETKAGHFTYLNGYSRFSPLSPAIILGTMAFPAAIPAEVWAAINTITNNKPVFENVK